MRGSPGPFKTTRKRVGRRGTPRDLTARGPAQGRSRGTQEAEWPHGLPRGHPPGLAPTTANTESRSRPWRALSRRVPRPTALRPYSARDATHRRRGRFGPRQGKRARAVTGPAPGSWCGVGGAEGRPAAMGRGGSHAELGPRDRDQKGRDTDGPPGKQARGPTVTHRSAVPRRLRRRTAPSTPGASHHPGWRVTAPPRAAEGPRPSIFSVCPQQIRLHLVRPRGSGPGDQLSSEAARPVPDTDTDTDTG